MAAGSCPFVALLTFVAFCGVERNVCSLASTKFASLARRIFAIAAANTAVATADVSPNFISRVLYQLPILFHPTACTFYCFRPAMRPFGFVYIHPLSTLKPLSLRNDIGGGNESTLIQYSWAVNASNPWLFRTLSIQSKRTLIALHDHLGCQMSHLEKRPIRDDVRISSCLNCF